MRKLSLCVLTPELVAWVPKKSDFHPMNQRVDARADTRVLTAEAQLAQLPQPRRHVVVGGTAEVGADGTTHVRRGKTVVKSVKPSGVMGAVPIFSCKGDAASALPDWGVFNAADRPGCSTGATSPAGMIAVVLATWPKLGGFGWRRGARAASWRAEWRP